MLHWFRTERKNYYVLDFFGPIQIPEFAKNVKKMCACVNIRVTEVMKWIWIWVSYSYCKLSIYMSHLCHCLDLEVFRPPYRKIIITLSISLITTIKTEITLKSCISITLVYVNSHAYIKPYMHRPLKKIRLIKNQSF